MFTLKKSEKTRNKPSELPHSCQLDKSILNFRGKGWYCKVPKFSDARKLCCNLPKIRTKSPNLSVFSQNDSSRIANSEDPDQTAPLGAV